MDIEIVRSNIIDLIHDLDTLRNIEVNCVDTCKKITNDLNKIFPDFKCKYTCYTLNTDKLVFGVYLTVDYGTSTLGTPDFEGAKKYPEGYVLEIDSRVCSTSAPISTIELAAIILNDINMVNNVSVLETINDMIVELKRSHPIIDPFQYDHTSLFRYVVQNTLRRLTSTFCGYDGKTVEDGVSVDMLEMFEMTETYFNALERLVSNHYVDYGKPGMLLQWYYSMAPRFKEDYASNIIFTVDHAIANTASKLELAMLTNVKTQIQTSDYPLTRQAPITESAKKGLLWQIKRNGLKSLEEDLYEYNMRLRNVETQDDAILLMRQINSRMSILEDYLQEDTLDDKDRTRWENVYTKYAKLREELSQKTVYNRKMYGLFVDYNALQQMSDNGAMMNTYY